MKKDLLNRHLRKYKSNVEADPEAYHRDLVQRSERTSFYQSWSADRIRGMSADDLSEYISLLWAMKIWGNKQYVVDKLLENNGLEKLRKQLSDLVWGSDNLAKRWDSFRSKIKGIGPAMMSEILCHVHPTECMLWNRRAYVGLRYLGVEDLPRYDYQLTGKKYVELSDVTRDICNEMQAMGFEKPNLLLVDYFLWEELQVEENLSQIHQKSDEKAPAALDTPAIDKKTSDFIHDEVKDKLADIGEWLGFNARTEVRVADGSKVDTIWEATIGNMGRVIYVFEVQTKGSIDSLILNLLKSLNNPAVQGVVAVSDAKQLDTIKKHAAAVQGLKEKLRYWDYVNVLSTYESLQTVNESINSLGLVPQQF